VRDLSQCPITDIKFTTDITTPEIAEFNYETIEVSRLENNVPLYLAFSKEIDSLPVTTLKIDNRPCMDPFYRPTANAHHQLEVNKFHGCPIEENTGQYFDHTFSGGDLQPFMVTEYDIQSHPMNNVER
jgi:hypothetical protein